jgi:hypothetical protein
MKKVKDDGFKKEIISSFKNPGYIFLHLGLLACGFHVAFLGTHLPGEISFYSIFNDCRINMGGYNSPNW